MIYSSLILFFAPQIGMALSIIIFTVMGIAIAVYAVKRSEPKLIYDYEAWRHDRKIALETGGSYPVPANYQIVAPAEVKTSKPKKVTNKKRALWPYLDMFGARF